MNDGGPAIVRWRAKGSISLAQENAHAGAAVALRTQRQIGYAVAVEVADNQVIEIWLIELIGDRRPESAVAVAQEHVANGHQVEFAVAIDIDRLETSGIGIGVVHGRS